MGTFFIKFCIATLQEYRERMEIDPVYEGAKVDFSVTLLQLSGGCVINFLKSIQEAPGSFLVTFVILQSIIFS